MLHDCLHCGNRCDCHADIEGDRQPCDGCSDCEEQERLLQDDDDADEDPYDRCGACGAGFDEDHDWDCPIADDDDEE